ncbi:MAG: toll/interleukin-1 receptor domain-containing protein [Oscillospiraceae bacterium]|nr:toll/interleukin-1 receptor domain-containing protein [Oscillospiraceae bacterium]
MSDSVKHSAFPAYAGTAPYIFISYAHSDSYDVLSVVGELQREHYRVWYDQGILPGSAWDENVAARLRDSQCVIAFVSRAYTASANCRDELSLARSFGKNTVLVHLDDSPMTPGMRMRYGRLFALFLHSMPEEEFYEKLASTENIGLTREV